MLYIWKKQHLTNNSNESCFAISKDESNFSKANCIQGSPKSGIAHKQGERASAKLSLVRV